MLLEDAVTVAQLLTHDQSKTGAICVKTMSLSDSPSTLARGVSPPLVGVQGSSTSAHSAKVRQWSTSRKACRSSASSQSVSVLTSLNCAA